MAFALIEIDSEYRATLLGVYELYIDADTAAIDQGLSDFAFRIVNYTKPKPRDSEAAREWDVARKLVRKAAGADRAFAAGLAAKGWSV